MARRSEWAILHFADGWRIVSEGRRFSRFDCRADAEEAALRLAVAARERGEQVTVLVQDDNSQMRVLDHGSLSMQALDPATE